MLRDAATAVCGAGEEPPRLPVPPVTTELGLEAIKKTLQLHRKHWPTLVDTADRPQPSGFGEFGFSELFRMVREREARADELAGGGTDSDSDSRPRSGDSGDHDEQRGGGGGGDDDKSASPAASDGRQGEQQAEEDEADEEQREEDEAEENEADEEREEGGQRREAGGPLAPSKAITKDKDGNLHLTAAALEAILAQAADAEEEE